MEACSGAHHWAREFQKFGHTVRLMAPEFVIPYRLWGKRGKNDAADTAAICEAVSRPNMRFVPVKNIEQQGQLLVHRARQGFVEQRGTKITGGKVMSGKKTKRCANRTAQALRLAAAALRSSESALGAYYRRLRARMDLALAPSQPLPTSWPD